MSGRSRCFIVGLFSALFVTLLHGQVRLGAPSYQDPGSPEWSGWEKPGPQAPGIMIVNLDNGDDGRFYGSVDRAIKATRAKGIFVIGYTYTGYGARDPKVIRSKIDAVYKNYLLDGIFFDETPTDCNATNPYFPTAFLYYQELTNYVREKVGARITVLNPGTYSPSDCWMGITNILMNWEDQGLGNYRDNYVEYAWVHKYPPDRFWHIVYGMPADQLTEAFELAKQRNAGWVYFTEETGNPYAGPPAYWRAESSRVAQQAVQAPFATAWPDSYDWNGLRKPGRVSVRWSSAVGTEWQVFFDTDRNAKTGYDGGGLAIGAEYMLHGDTSGAQLLRYTGSGADWSWKEVSARAQLDALDAHVWTANFDTAGLGGAGKMSYQIRALDASGNPLGDSYVLILDTANTGLVFDIFNHRQ